MGPGQLRRAGHPEQAERGEAYGDEGHGLGADPDAERGDGAGEARRAAVLRRRREAGRESDQDQRQQQEQAVMVGPADAGVGEHGRLGEEDQTGEQPAVAVERRARGPGEGDDGEREQGRADQHAPQMQRALEAQKWLQQPGARQQQRIQRPRPVLDMPFGRVDPRLARIEPGAAVVQVQHAREPHVGIGIGERAVEDRHDPGQRDQRLHEHQAAERDRHQPAKCRLVGCAATECGRLRRHHDPTGCDEAPAPSPPPG